MAYRSNITNDMMASFFTPGGLNVERKVFASATNRLGLPQHEDDDDLEDDDASTRRGAGDSIAYAESLKHVEAMAAHANSLFMTFAPSQGNAAGGGGSQGGSLYEVDELTSRGTMAGMHDLSEDTLQLYAKYKFDRGLPMDATLSVHESKQEIVKVIESNQAVVIHGATGSGKTTQIPQYVLEDHARRKKHCNIVVTQPRRIAAISVADRVCRERDWPLGGMVSYQVGLDNKCSADTRLRYVTTGVLLQQLVNNKNMNEYTHIFLDEVHERDQDSDFVMLVVKKFLNTNSRSVKVVLMSATAETEVFRNYFSTPICGRNIEAPDFKIKKHMYEICEFYLEDLEVLHATLPEVDVVSPTISMDMYRLAVNLVVALDRVESGGAEVVELADNRGAVLIFLPGLEEIVALNKMLAVDSVKYKWSVLPVHSSVTVEEQKRVFVSPTLGFRKIILSTNICESSITVTDIVYVIDFCLTKSMYLDPNTNYQSLRLEWASHSNCDQRRGRVGRVMPGRVYRLVPRKFYLECLNAHPTPEMRRCPGEQLVLKAKMLNLGSPCSILGLAIDPPTLNDIERAVLTLKEVWALLTTCNGKYEHYDGDLTTVGEILSSLPIDVRLGKLIVLGHVFGCLDDCVVIAAGLSLQSFFSRPFGERLKAYKTKFLWAEDSFSDCIAICNVYNVWQHYKRTRYFHRPGGLSEEAWCSRHFVQLKRLRDVERLARELHCRLEKYDIRSLRNADHRHNKVEDWLVLRLVVCGAFYPNYFTQGPLDEKTIVRTLSGKDPMRTVMIGGLPSNQGVLYAEAIQKMFRDACEFTNMNTHFEDTKALVEFGHSTLTLISSDKKMCGLQVAPEVYHAIKMRLLRHNIEIYRVSDEEAQSRLHDLACYSKQKDEESGVKRLRSNRCRVKCMRVNTLTQVPLPGFGCPSISIFISHQVDCGHFWAQYKDNETDAKLRGLQCDIQRCVENSNFPARGPIVPNNILLAPFSSESDDTVCYYRARVESVDSQSVEVFFVDFGNRTTVPKSSLREIDEEAFPSLLVIPTLAFECKLSRVKPIGTQWTEDARVYFLTLTNGRKLTGRIYSVIYDMVRLELLLDRDVCVNNELVARRYAVVGEELLVSKQNNEMRMRTESDTSAASWTAYEYDDARLLPHSLIKSTKNPCETGVKLRLQGPSSPVEMSFFSLQKKMVFGSIHVDPDSINSVALDAEPHDKHDRLLVAAQVSTNAGATTLSARNTTLLPNIHGLLSTVCLLFAPMAELRCDSSRSRYTGAICGLGHDERGKSLYPEHDMEIEFDTRFDHHVLFLINIVRYGINLTLGRATFHGDFGAHQKRARDQLIKLAFTFRESEHKVMAGRNQNKWNVLGPHKMETTVENMEDVVQLLPLLNAIHLVGQRVPSGEQFSADDVASVVSSMDLDNIFDVANNPHLKGADGNGD